MCREPCGPLETGGGTSVYDDVGFPDGSEETSPSLFLLLITKGLGQRKGRDLLIHSYKNATAEVSMISPRSHSEEVPE